MAAVAVPKLNDANQNPGVRMRFQIHQRIQGNDKVRLLSFLRFIFLDADLVINPKEYGEDIKIGDVVEVYNPESSARLVVMFILIMN